MDVRIAVNPLLQPHTWGIHEYIFLALMGVLGWLLQLKYVTATASPFVTHYVTMLMFIVVFIVYFGALTAKIFSQTPNSDMAEFMTNITLLSGTLASILLLHILVRAFGCFALLLWAIYLVRDVVTKKSYRKALVHVFDKVKVLIYGPSEESNAVQPPPIAEVVVPIQDGGQHNVEERKMEQRNGKQPLTTPLPKSFSQPGLPV